MRELEQADQAFLNELTQILRGEHWDPHHFLGLHPFFEGKKIIRLYRPNAKEVFLELFGKIEITRKIHEGGLFDHVVDGNTTYKDYRVYHQNGLLAEDPYAFPPMWGETDSYLFNQGVHYQLYEVMGAHECTHLGIRGVKFAVWAPNAMRVSVVGDFNFWDGRINPMRSLGESGVWELFIPGLQNGERYKYEIKTQQGEVIIKSDPYAHANELRPMNASKVASVNFHSWQDFDWLEKRRREANDSKPLNIYEVHLGSWKFNHGRPYTYRELAT
ncbi:MAG: 1,4-alpha-glucan branching enzyme, partial [Chlamydiales bacterium]